MISTLESRRTIKIKSQRLKLSKTLLKLQLGLGMLFFPSHYSGLWSLKRRSVKQWVTTDIGFLPVAFCWVLPCLFAISLAVTPTPLLFPVKMNYYSVQKLISSNSLRTYRSVGLWEILWNYITYKVTWVKQTLLLTEPLRVLKVKVTKSRTKHKANGSTKY